MTRQDSRTVYAARMHRVQAYIDEHLDQPLDLAQLASVARFSEFHFHRLFAAWMGETLGDYLRRRRLQLAAMRLVAQPRLSVLAVALSVGWGSGEAFARAFKVRFGASPSRWRAQARKQGQPQSNPDQAVWSASIEHGLPANAFEEQTMNVQLIDRSPVRIAYMRHVGPYGQAVHAFWTRQVAPWLASQRLLGQPRYGISHDDPSITAAEQCRYDAAVEIDDRFVAAAGVFTTTLPGGRYASLPFEGTSAQIGAAWQALLRGWLADSGLQLDARPCFEYYPPDARYDAASGSFSCNIVIPVTPL
jgi:AraC family transcriptional regulator